MRPNPLSTKEIHGLSVFYVGVGMFFATFVVFIHPVAPLCAGGLISLLGAYVVGSGRADRVAAHRKQQAEKRA